MFGNETADNGLFKFKRNRPKKNLLNYLILTLLLKTLRFNIILFK